MIWASLIPVAIAAVRAVEGAFGAKKGAAKASTARGMVSAALSGVIEAGVLTGADAVSVDLGTLVEMAVQILKERGDLGGVKAPAKVPAKDAGDNPPMQMSMPAGAVLTIQF